MKAVLAITIIMQLLSPTEACIQLLDNNWKPISTAEKTKSATFVLTATILSTTPSFKSMYSAKFEVINVLKGWDSFKKLYKKSPSIETLTPKIVASADGFTDDTRFCFSSVKVGETYVLFLGYRSDNFKIVAKYDDLFGAAEKLYKRIVKNILESLGWQDWSSWSNCDRFCGNGRQYRSRSCKQDHVCEGPTRQLRECNTFSCQNIKDALKFILDFKRGTSLIIQTKEDAFPRNGVQRIEPPSAPSYMLFRDGWLKQSVLHISFKGAVRDSQYLFSMYNANQKMTLGVKVTRFNLDIVFDKEVDSAVSLRETRSFLYDFMKDAWYNIAVVLQLDSVKLLINCEELHTSKLNERLFDNTDMFGSLYIGAGGELGAERNALVEIKQVMFSEDMSSQWKQCGKIIMDDKNSMGGSGFGDDSDTESGDSPNLDDTESSGVDFEGCDCSNRGECHSDGTCMCSLGWTGEKCDIAICNRPCMNNGNCTQPNVCICKPGTSGSYCQFTECLLPCVNGVCVGPNTCKCEQGFHGKQCKKRKCMLTCLNGGRCLTDDKCKCLKGFVGSKCESKRDCTKYGTRLVSHLKPSRIYKYVTEIVPCPNSLGSKCKRKRVMYETVNHITYRPDYVCVT